MITRCKRGDLAIIINETPKCEANIGRIVRARGPFELMTLYNLYCWSIKPIDNGTLLCQSNHVFEDPVAVYCEWKNPKFCPDSWLLPIRSAGKITKKDVLQDLPEDIIRLLPDVQEW